MKIRLLQAPGSLFVLLCLLSQPGYSQTFGTPKAVVNPFSGTGGSVGLFSSMKIVNGNPTIAFYDASRFNLCYVRATDAGGTTWSTPQIIDATGVVGQYNSLQTVNGNPAIAYYDATNGDLKYIQATDASGTTWGTPQAIDATGNVGSYTSLQIVNGNPAISYFDVTNSDLKYIRATDASGTTWGTPQTLDATGNVGSFISLQIVNGNPAISYFDVTNSDLKYVRATDASGTTWGTPQTLDATGTVGQYTSLQIVNGNPAIAYYDGTNLDLKYVRATNASGTAWGTPLAIDATGAVGLYTSLQIVNGNPAISYYDGTNSDLKYVRASDLNGATWATPQTLASTGTTGQYTNMISQGTGAAIAFYDASETLPYFVASFVSLPVTLTHIAGQWKNTAIQLNWQVAGESDIEGYVVERSGDGKTFMALGTVVATNGIGNANYNYLDASPLTGTNYYRLRIIEISGALRYSSVVTMKAASDAGQHISVYPNPVKGNTLQYEVNLPAGVYTAKVVNSAGVVVSASSYQHNGGTIVNVLPVSVAIPDGLYHLIISNNKAQVSTHFVK